MFLPSGIVEIPSDHMYVHTIPLCECIDGQSRYKPFSSQA